jgi:hypothetical protein
MVLQLHPDWDTLQHLDFTTSIVVFFIGITATILQLLYIICYTLRTEGAMAQEILHSNRSRSQSQDFPDKKAQAKRAARPERTPATGSPRKTTGGFQ